MFDASFLHQLRHLSAGEIVAVAVVAVTGLAALVEWVQWLGTTP